MEARKTEGQVFTPTHIVTLILDSVGYAGPEILNKTIMEPSFGNGAFLKEIVARIIQEGKSAEKSAKAISEIIKKCVFGIEKDTRLYDEAIHSLNALLAAEGIPAPSWENLICADTLLSYDKYVGEMDFCVGNPPYVRIHNMTDDCREAVRQFSFSNGMADLYVIFYEIGIKLLKKGSGKLAYITPNSFLRNASQKRFRYHLLNQNLLSAIYNFKDSKIFAAQTYPCICILDQAEKTSIEYREYKGARMLCGNRISYDRLVGASMWNLACNTDLAYLEENAARPIKLKQLATIQNGVSTNRDSIYIGKAWLDQKPYTGKHTDPNKTVFFNGAPMESAILRRCVKASRYNGSLENLYILYPYRNGSTPYTEEELKKSFPHAYQYLCKNKESLASRDMDDAAPWFAFARSQGLVHSEQKKLVFKHIINKTEPSIRIHELESDIVVYAGLFITATDSYANLTKILSDPDFHKYCVLVGKDMQGGYAAVSSTSIKNYGIPQG